LFEAVEQALADACEHRAHEQAEHAADGPPLTL
jgi:hypothetical protein